MNSLRLPFFLLLSVATGAFAQSTGAITGQITDQSQAAVPGATVTVRAVETGVVYKTTSNGEGYYTVPSLLPVDYTVSAELEGFKKSVAGPIKLDTTAVVRVDLVLSPGEAKQVVEVVAQTSSIETETAMVGETVTQREMDALPLQGRNTLELAMTAPGVGGEVGSDAVVGAGLSLSGGRAGSSSIMADGLNSSSVSIGRATVTMSPDMIQEFKVITSTFSAQYGNSGGGFISMVSKSGTDQLRGTAYWFTRRPELAARKFNQVQPPQLDRNNFGVTLGGPVYLPKIYNGRRRTFFLFSVEPTRSIDGNDALTRVPTAEERAGDFRNSWVAPGQINPLLYRHYECSPSPTNCQKMLPYHRNSATEVFPLFGAGGDPSSVGHVIPSAYIDPLATKILEDVPMPNMPYDVNGNNYLGVKSTKAFDNRYTAKIDHMLSDGNRLSVRYTRQPSRTDISLYQKNNYFLGANPAENNQVRQYFVSDSATITPHIVNEFRFGYVFGDFSRTLPGDMSTVNYTTDKFGLPSSSWFGSPQFRTGWPSIIGPSGNAIELYKEHQFQGSDELTVIRGRHTLIFGGDYRLSQVNAFSSGLNNLVAPQYQFTANQTASGNANIPTGAGGLQFASFLLGVPSTVATSSVVIPYYYRWKVASAFIQDNVKVTPTFTLNLGVRWQYNSPRWEKYNRQASVDLANPVDLVSAAGRKTGVTFNYLYAGASGSRYLSQNYPKNVEPRIGWAWAPRWKPLGVERFSLRGGYGVSHVPIAGEGRTPYPQFGTGSSNNPYTYSDWTGTATAKTYTAVAPNYLIGLSRNLPVLIADPTVSQIPADGKLCIGCTPTDSRVPGTNIVFDAGGNPPYIQTWSFTMEGQLPRAVVVRVGYLGQKGTHLQSPLMSINSADQKQYDAMLAAGLDPTELIPDPLGRVDSQGRVLSVARSDSLRPYPSLGEVLLRGATNSSSIYHAGTLDVIRQQGRRFTYRFNYTWSKGIDTTSDSNGDNTNYFSWGRSTPQNPKDLKNERSVSLFDTRHRFNLTFIGELPFGRGKALLGGANRLVNTIVGGWNVSGVAALVSGRPVTVFLGQQISNGIAGANSNTWQRVRPDIVPGVPIINPRWSKSVANDVPYLNPEAFAIPAYGHYGNAPRTYDYARNPWTSNLDLSFAKEFRPFQEGRRYFQFRGEFFNVLNHVNFKLPRDNAIFSSNSLPITPTSNLAGSVPYLYGAGSRSYSFPTGSRDAIVANAMTTTFGVFARNDNSSGRIVQLALKFYF